MDRRRTNLMRIQISLIAFFLTACNVVYTDDEGNKTISNLLGEINYELMPKVKEAIENSGAAPTNGGFKNISIAFKNAQFSNDCSGSEADYLSTYQAIEYLKYYYNEYPVDDLQVKNSVLFLNRCIDKGAVKLVGPALSGLGMHGTVDDAETIFDRISRNDGERFLTYAAIGLKHICNPIADEYLEKLLVRAIDDNVKTSIKANIENRDFYKTRCIQKITTTL